MKAGRASRSLFGRFVRSGTFVFVVGASGLILSACSGGESESSSESTTQPAPTERTESHGLTPEQAEAPLAVVGSRTITLGEFAELLESKGPFLRARYASLERRSELLDQLVRFELLAQEAEREGYFDDPEVQRARKQTLIRQYMRQEFEDRIQLSDVSDEDVAAYYAEHRRAFERPEQVRAAVIAMRDRATAQRVLRQLRDSDDPRLFRELAERHNTEPRLRDRFGDLGYFSAPSEGSSDPNPSGEEAAGEEAAGDEAREEAAGEEREAAGEERETDPAEARPNRAPVPDAVARAAFAIDDVGELHPEVIATDSGFYVLKLTGRRAAQTRTLEQATRTIRHRLWRTRRQEALENEIRELRSAADVEEHPELLSEVHVPDPDDAPRPAAPHLHQFH